MGWKFHFYNYRWNGCILMNLLIYTLVPGWGNFEDNPNISHQLEFSCSHCCCHIYFTLIWFWSVRVCPTVVNMGWLLLTVNNSPARTSHIMHRAQHTMQTWPLVQKEENVVIKGKAFSSFCRCSLAFSWCLLFAM